MRRQETRFARAERLPTSVTQPIYDSDTNGIRFVDVPQPRERPTALEIETAAAAAAAGLAAGADAAARDAAEQGAGADAQDGEFHPPEQLSDFESDSDSSSGAGEHPAACLCSCRAAATTQLSRSRLRQAAAAGAQMPRLPTAAVVASPAQAVFATACISPACQSTPKRQRRRQWRRQQPCGAPAGSRTITSTASWRGYYTTARDSASAACLRIRCQRSRRLSLRLRPF